MNLREAGFTGMPLHLARFMAGLCGTNDADLALAMALVSQATANGDVCLDLSAHAARTLPGASPLRCPPLISWRDKLAACPVVGKAGDFRPLILDEGNRLYLYRYWDYENRITRNISRRAGKEMPVDAGRLQDSMDRLFPEPNGSLDLQKTAALVSALKPLCVITGGPGTGKTFTVARILAMLLEQPADHPLRIFLCAPTGKAAARLGQSIQEARGTLNCRPEILEAVGSETFTIHRMLQPVNGSPYFRYNGKNPLPADVIVVDEASMVDLALMSKLMEAAPEQSRIILLGDRDQLASVEAGSVLGDICDEQGLDVFSAPFVKSLHALGQSDFTPSAGHASNSGLSDCIVRLRKTFRFAADSGIGALCEAVNQGQAEKVIELLTLPPDESIGFSDPGSSFFPSLEKTIIEGYRPMITARDPLEALKEINRFKVLCAIRSGHFGVQGVNRLAENALERCGLIRAGNGWYRGRPVLITRNDYASGLYNGDLGIVFSESPESELLAFFTDGSGGLRGFTQARLPEHETAFAMTVHKSQGSEFDSVVLILPETDSALLTRELVYTGVTRARRSVRIGSGRAVLSAAISRSMQRASGLRDALWKPGV